MMHALTAIGTGAGMDESDRANYRQREEMVSGLRTAGRGEKSETVRNFSPDPALKNNAPHILWGEHLSITTLISRSGADISRQHH